MKYKLTYEEGDEVTEGETIVELENDELKALFEQARAGVEKARADVSVSESAIEESKANIKGAEADIKNAEADVNKAQVQLEEAKRELTRQNKLYEQNFIPRQSLDIALTNVDTAVAIVKSSEAKLKAAFSKKEASLAQLKTTERQYHSALASLQQAEASLSFSKTRLEETIIKSPMSGTIVYKALEKGEIVSPGITILTIVDLNNLYVRVDIDESMVENIGLHSKAVIRTTGVLDRTVNGEVNKIGTYAEFATQKDLTRGRQDIKTFKVEISVDNSEGILKPGMTVNVEIFRKDTL